MTRLIAGLLFGMILATSGCADKNHVPSDVLPHDKMEDVMWDIIQSEQYSSTFLTKDSAHLNLKEESLRLYDQVFRLHHISREEFEKSYKYYFTRADLAEVIFDSLRVKGERLRAESYGRPSRSISTPTPAPAVTPTTTPGHPSALTPSHPSALTPGKLPVTSPAKTPGTPATTPASRFVPTSVAPPNPRDTAAMRRFRSLPFKKQRDSLRTKPV